MHLGVNLCVAFLKGMRLANEREGIDEGRHNPVDTFVHGFSKLFGSHGVPEYGVGAVNFPDFIELQDESSDDAKFEINLRLTLFVVWLVTKKYNWVAMPSKKREASPSSQHGPYA